MPALAPQSLRDFVTAMFVAAGASEADAAAVVGHLVQSNLKGHDSHGVMLAPGYLRGIAEGRTELGAEIRTETQSETTAVVDGGWNFGQIVARYTMEIAIAKARTTGVGIAVAHRSTHVGRVGAYTEQAVAAGMIGIAMVNNHGGAHQVAPFGGTGRRLSTNPMSFGFPTGDGDAPFILDMATSAGAAGKMNVARNKGVTVPDDWLIDAEGVPTNDPNALYDPPPGAILAFGGNVGHKGFGLSMVVEALAGALSPAGTSRPDFERGGNGLFTMAIDPDHLGGASQFTGWMDGLIEWVKRPPYSEGVDQILTAGEPERRAMQERAAAIPLDDTTWGQLTEAASTLGIEPPSV